MATTQLLNFQSKCYQKLSKLLENNTPSQSDSFLFGHLLKSKHLIDSGKVPVDDINDSNLLVKSSSLINNNFYNHMNHFQRYEALKNFKLKNIMAAPGHRFLRKPEQIEGLVKYLSTNPNADFSHDKLLINIVTDNMGRVTSVDLWNAHHRMVSFIKAGMNSIGDIDAKNFEILVNGVTTYQDNWTHYLSSAGINWKMIHSYNNVSQSEIIREGTISVSGRHSNFDLGSRNSIGQLYKNVFNSNKGKLKIGVYFGTFDPIHEGHISVIKSAIKAKELDEVLIVPNVNPIHKSPKDIRHRNSMVALRIQKEQNINLYLADSSEVIDRYGRNPFFERVMQIYGTKNIYQLIGSDSFFKLASSGQIQSSNFRKYLVMPRKEDNLDELKKLSSEKAEILLNEVDEAGMSSTKIRNKVKNNQEISKEELDLDVLEYIQSNQLYKD